MRNSVYPINKGINKPIEFKGLKAQYIWYLGGAVIGLLLLFTILYALGLHAFLCLGIILVTGGLLTRRIYRLSNTYGRYGMMKKVARRRVPAVVTSSGRALFLGKEIKQDA
ncbi:DUF4133 domain-containing protein [Pontibacter liquoris]|uniref:DUF4133 domain-containing protein n=1 Tax=Pontibacter liquoris TaxID=2905677 RepID=UPI001FA7A7EC|nr:DUF4133 domain-containing protein [Pontibacter liquoris]